MSVPVKLLRNARHSERPRFCVFDDLQTSLLLSLFLRFRDVYKVDKKLVAKILFDDVVCDLESASSYTDEKRLLNQECVQFSQHDVVELLQHFDSLDDLRLSSLEDKYIDKISRGTKRVVFQEIVVPRITHCLFCTSSALALKVKTQTCGWKAPGGHSWAYDFLSGGRIAAVCEATCPRCQTVYKLQTYTPGPQIIQRSGVVVSPACAGFLSTEQQTRIVSLYTSRIMPALLVYAHP